MHSSLEVILKNPGADSLELYFNYDVNVLGVTTTKELIPGGSELKVTDKNKFKYSNLFCEA